LNNDIFHYGRTDNAQTDTNHRHLIYKFPYLQRGTLIKRYKRFLADIAMPDGRIITAHCPNSGSMRTCSEPGMPVWFSESSNPKRRLPYTWELIQMNDSLVGVNAIIPNKLIKSAVSFGILPELSGYHEIISEIKTNENTRLDLCLKSQDQKQCFIEIKNCTFVENRVVSFPDAVTSRGKKHLEELSRLITYKNRCVILFIVQRMDADVFVPADSIDPEYGKALRKAVSEGVEILVYDTYMSIDGIAIRRRINTLL
jgi:sugar fermentation stimulation protein A